MRLWCWCWSAPLQINGLLISLVGHMIWVTLGGSAPRKAEHYSYGLWACCEQDVGLLCFRVNFPTHITCISWAAGFACWEHTWLFHGFCWANIHSVIPYSSPLQSGISSVIICFLITTSGCAGFHRSSPHSLWSSAHPLLLKIPHCLPSCQELLPALLPLWLIPFCLEFGRNVAFRKHFPLPFVIDFILMLINEWIQANDKQNCHILFTTNLCIYFLVSYRIQCSHVKYSFCPNQRKKRGKLTKWKMKIFSLENGRKKKELILAPHRVHEKYSHIIVTI